MFANGMRVSVVTLSRIRSVLVSCAANVAVELHVDLVRGLEDERLLGGARRRRRGEHAGRGIEVAPAGRVLQLHGTDHVVVLPAAGEGVDKGSLSMIAVVDGDVRPVSGCRAVNAVASDRLARRRLSKRLCACRRAASAR